MKKLKILFVLAIFGGFLISAGAVHAYSYGGAWKASVDEVFTIPSGLADNQTFGVNAFGGNVCLNYDVFNGPGHSYRLTLLGFPAVCIHDAEPVASPLPSSAFLMGSGIVGLIGFGLRRRRRRNPLS